MSSPWGPGAVGWGKPGIVDCGMRIADCTASATDPSPDPKTMATVGCRSPRRRRTASAASPTRVPILLAVGSAIPHSAVRIPHLDEYPRQRRRQEIGERPGNHGAEAEAGEIVLTAGDQRADPPDLDADGPEVGEAARCKSRQP